MRRQRVQSACHTLISWGLLTVCLIIVMFTAHVLVAAAAWLYRRMLSGAKREQSK